MSQAHTFISSWAHPALGILGQHSIPLFLGSLHHGRQVRSSSLLSIIDWKVLRDGPLAKLVHRSWVWICHRLPSDVLTKLREHPPLGGLVLELLLCNRILAALKLSEAAVKFSLHLRTRFMDRPVGSLAEGPAEALTEQSTQGMMQIHTHMAAREPFCSLLPW